MLIITATSPRKVVDTECIAFLETVPCDDTADQVDKVYIARAQLKCQFTCPDGGGTFTHLDLYIGTQAECDKCIDGIARLKDGTRLLDLSLRVMPEPDESEKVIVKMKLTGLAATKPDGVYNPFIDGDYISFWYENEEEPVIQDFQSDADASRAYDLIMQAISDGKEYVEFEV